MNNKKIIFGILLFCAISFIAYTFANPLEKEDDEGRLVPGSNQIQNTGNDKDNNDNDDDQIDEPIKVDDPNDDDSTTNDPIATNPTNTNQNGNTTTTTPSRPSSGSNSGSGSNNSGTSKPTTPTTPNVPVTGVNVNVPSDNTLLAGNTINLGASVSPSNATNKNITYTSSNNNVVKVDENGNVTAIGAGSATVTITSNGVSTTVTFNVVANTASKITAEGIGETSISKGPSSSSTTLKLIGSVPKNTNHSMAIRIYVPSNYTEDLLQNLKYNLVKNVYIHSDYYTFSGINKINDVSLISSGNAYVSMNLEFNDAVILGTMGDLYIDVDWLNTGSPIRYTLDFSGVVIKE